MKKMMVLGRVITSMSPLQCNVRDAPVDRRSWRRLPVKRTKRSTAPHVSRELKGKARWLIKAAEETCELFMYAGKVLGFTVVVLESPSSKEAQVNDSTNTRTDSCVLLAF